MKPLPLKGNKTMKLEDKIRLTAEARNLLAKKEVRNKAITIGIGLVGTISGLLVEKKLEKNLLNEFFPAEDSTPSED